MSALEMFEADLRFKVDSKCPSGQMEERFLNKSFQFFDFHRSGMIDFTQFYKTLERVGVIATKTNAEKIFNEIIRLGFGEDEHLNYKEYAKRVYNPASFDRLDTQVHKPLSTPVYEDRYPTYDLPVPSSHYSESSPPKSASSQHANIKRSGFKQTTSDTVETIMDELKQRIKMRGSKGFINLQRQFKLTDTNSIGTVNQYEFSKILREYDLNLLESQYYVLFNAFDRYKDGQIDYKTFTSKQKPIINF
jgi:Ca2+-binding EF-hand superfamily protein